LVSEQVLYGEKLQGASDVMKSKALEACSMLIWAEKRELGNQNARQDLEIELFTDKSFDAPPQSRRVGKTMGRAELARSVYKSCVGLTRSQSEDWTKTVLEEISAALVRGEHVKLRGFGAFCVRAKRKRMGRNPRTGDEAPITARRVLTFKASRTFIATINREAEHIQASDASESGEQTVLANARDRF
jgi:integration host factor subunit alpha